MNFIIKPGISFFDKEVPVDNWYSKEERRRAFHSML